MRQYTVLAGKRVRSDLLERGDFLLMDGGKWAERAWLTERRRCWLFFTINLIVYLPAIVTFFLASSGEAGIEFYIIFISIAIFNTLIWTLFSLGGLWMGLRAVDKGPGVPGLYAYGIQTELGPFGGGSFIPYGEIERIKRQRVFFLDMVVIYVKGRSFRYAAFPRVMLGDEGMGTLLMMAGREPRPPGPPRLVLYAPADSPLPTRPMDDDTGSTGSGVAVSTIFPQGRY